MKYVKLLGLAALSAMALMAFASTASATTLEVGGSAKNESVSIKSNIATGTSALLEDTSAISQNTCTTSNVEGSSSSPFTATKVTGAVSSLTFSNCDRTVTVHAAGKLYVEWTSGTNGKVGSEEAEVTSGSPFGTLTCVTGTGTHIGTLTGVASGNATMHINAVLDCGISARWTGTYTVTSPSGLGVVS
jgi:hypothetical protein